MANRVLQFTNCSILRDHKIIVEDLWVRNGTIIDPEKIFFDEKRIADEKFDCNGSLISPGFIDIQINGGFGVDFSHDIDNIEEAVNKVAKGILSHGVTSFCPTLVTSQPNVYRKVLPKLPRRDGGKHGATILGVHVEGPFINKDKKGAHDENSIVSLKKGPEAVEEMYGCFDNIRIITLAPELPGALDVIKYMKKKNVTVSIGLVLVTDAISAMGLQEGTHFVGQLCVEVRGGCAFIAGTDTLCGSIATMIDCVRNLKSATGCSLVEALEAGSLHPAEALGLNSHKGTLSFGADADFVMLTQEDLQVRSTWIAGSCVYESRS